MKLRNRFLLIGVGVFLFSLTTPFLVLYARGFKFDFANKQIIKTGSFVIKTEPDDAEILIDNIKQKKLTPGVIRFLLPKDYTFTIKKDNYGSWTKRLTIKPQLVTWANLNREFVALFFVNPEFKNQITTTGTSASFDLNEIAFTEGEEIKILNTQTNQIKTLGSAKGQDINLNSKLVWSNGAQIYESLTKLNQSINSDKDLQEIQTNGDYSVVLMKNTLYKVNPSLPLSLLAPKVSGFTLEEQNVWFISSNQLIRLNLGNLESQTIYEAIPNHNQVKIIRSDNHVFLLLDSTLYKLNDDLEKIYDSINQAFWDKKSQRLLAYNNNEILLFDPLDSQNPELILRSVSPIIAAKLNWYTGYVFFQNEGKIKAIELDGRDHRNVYTTSEALDNFIISQDGKLLYGFNQDEIKTYEIR